MYLFSTPQPIIHIKTIACLRKATPCIRTGKITHSDHSSQHRAPLVKLSDAAAMLPPSMTTRSAVYSTRNSALNPNGQLHFPVDLPFSHHRLHTIASSSTRHLPSNLSDPPLPSARHRQSSTLGQPSASTSTLPDLSAPPCYLAYMFSPTGPTTPPGHRVHLSTPLGHTVPPGYYPPQVLPQGHPAPLHYPALPSPAYPSTNAQLHDQAPVSTLFPTENDPSHPDPSINSRTGSSTYFLDSDAFPTHVQYPSPLISVCGNSTSTAAGAPASLTYSGPLTLCLYSTPSSLRSQPIPIPYAVASPSLRHNLLSVSQTCSSSRFHMHKQTRIHYSTTPPTSHIFHNCFCAPPSRSVLPACVAFH